LFVRKTKLARRFCLAAAICGLNAGIAEGATRNASFSASVTITAGCATNLAFGQWDAPATGVGSTAAVSVVCSNTAPYSIGFASNGRAPSQATLEPATYTDTDTITVTY
jgi:spore coat protein U-like protein